MRTFTAKKIKVVDATGHEVKEAKLSHKDLAMTCLNTSTEGLSVQDMRLRFKVIDKIENLEPNETAELEDAEWQTLTDCVNEVDNKKQWTVMDREIIAFVDAINTAPNEG